MIFNEFPKPSQRKRLENILKDILILSLRNHSNVSWTFALFGHREDQVKKEPVHFNGPFKGVLLRRRKSCGAVRFLRALHRR